MDNTKKMNTKKRNILKTRTINQIKTIQNIIRIRKEKGLSQEHTAEVIGLSRSYYNRIENFSNSITMKHIHSLSVLFEVNVDDLVVYDRDYNEGYCDCLNDFGIAHFSNILYSYLQLDKYLDIRLGLESALYFFLIELGYEVKLINVKSAKELVQPLSYLEQRLQIPEERVLNDEMDKIFYVDDLGYRMAVLLKKNNKIICIWSLEDYFKFEEFLKISTCGYIDNLVKKFKEKVEFPDKSRSELLLEDEIAIEKPSSTDIIKERIKNAKKIIIKINESLEREVKK